MKKFIGLCILVILLVAASGCTQPAKPAQVTPAPTAVVTTAEQQIPVVTTLPPTIVETTVLPTTTAPPVTTVAATTVIPTVKEAPKRVVVPQITVTTFVFRNNTFTPKELIVLPGTGIAWLNEDNIVHAVKTIGVHEGMFNSGDIIPTASWGYTFSQDEGVYDFKDPYSGATGTVIVIKGASVVGVPTMETPTPATTKA